MSVAGLQGAIFHVTHQGERLGAIAWLPGFSWRDVDMTEYLAVQVIHLRPATWQGVFEAAMALQRIAWQRQGFRPVGWALVDACDRQNPMMAAMLQRIPR